MYDVTSVNVFPRELMKCPRKKRLTLCVPYYLSPYDRLHGDTPEMMKAIRIIIRKPDFRTD